MSLVGDGGAAPPPNWPRSARWWSVTQWLIAINIGVFVVDLLSRGRLTDLGSFSADAAVYRLQFWRWMTNLFLHADPYHLAVNMLVLWAIGPIAESRLQRARFLALYLFSGIGGLLSYLLFWRLEILSVTRYTQLIGASGCCFGVTLAAAHLAPHVRVRFYWTVSLTLRTIAWICVGLAVLTVAAHGVNAGGEAAHLGGAAVGYALVRNLHWFSAMRIGPRRRRFWQPGDPAANFFRSDAD
jgi:membrane associated rhomboid family serine protease